MGTRVLRTIGTLAAFAAIVAGVAAQERPAPASPDQPVFRTGISTVRVDVIVTDNKGNPVSDLKQTDFEVFEDNKPQKVETFRLVKIDTTTPGYTTRTIRSRNDEETAAADENSRIFIFFLDDYHVRLGSSMSVRKPVMEFIANQLSPNDLIGVMYPLTPIDAVVLTRNHQGVINTVEKFVGRKFDYEPRNDLEAGYVYRYSSEVIELIRRQVSLSALRGISQKLGSLREGRKSIILVSEGYTAMLPPQMRDAIGGFKGSGDNPARRDPFAGDGSVVEDRAKFSAEIDMQSELRDVFDAANRNNTSIYSVDPRGLSTGEFDIADNISQTTSNAALNSTMDTLRVLSENTDGRAIVNRNDLAAGMKQIINDSSAYYLVGYTSSPAPTDGKFHAIKVRVKRPGLQVRARKGYWAYTEADVARAVAGPKAGPPPALAKALAAIVPMTNHRFIRTWIGTSRGANGLTKVTFLWEPLAATPGARRDDARRVTLLASSPAGDLIYRSKVPAELAAVGAGALTSFDVKPGRLELKITIEGAGTGTLDSEDREIAVPDLGAPEPMFSTPRVWFARNAREFSALSADAKAPPTALREFRRTDRLLLRFEAFAPAGAPLTTTAQLLNQQGTKMMDVAVTPPTEAGQSNVVDLPLANLAAGQYLLELTAKTEGHEPVTELVAFRVAS